MERKEEQNDYIRYQEIDGELERLFYSEKPGDTEKYDRLDAEHDRLYEKLYPKEWFGKLLDLKRQMENPGEVYLGQYINSAGEIEARETASRRNLTAEERKNKMPDFGWDRALLTEGGEGTSKVQLSLDNPEGFAEAITQWDADGRRKTDFILGSTGEVLQGLGAIEGDVYMRSEKIETILKQHPEMSLEEIKKIPSVLNDPVLVLKSRQSDSKRGNSRVVVFGSMKNTNGAPMLAVLDLRPVEGNLLIEDMQKVVSAYVKTGNPAGFLKNSEAMFVDKKRAARLLRSTGLQLRPGSLPPSGYIGSITYRGKNVNITGKQFSEFLQETKETGNENLTTIRNLNEDDLAALYGSARIPVQELLANTEGAGDVSLIVKNEDTRNNNAHLENMAAVIPSSVDWWLVERLKMNGLNVVEYRAGNEQARQEAETEAEKLLEPKKRFSLSPEEKVQRAENKLTAAQEKLEQEKEKAQERYKRDLTSGTRRLFNIQSYDSKELNGLLETPMLEMQQGVKLLKAEKDDLFEALMDLGTATLPADDYYREIREALRGRRIFVPEGIREDFGDDWGDFRKKAFSSGIYFTDKASDRSVDVHMHFRKHLLFIIWGICVLYTALLLKNFVQPKARKPL